MSVSKLEPPGARTEVLEHLAELVQKVQAGEIEGVVIFSTGRGRVAFHSEAGCIDRADTLYAMEAWKISNLSDEG